MNPRRHRGIPTLLRRFCCIALVILIILQFAGINIFFTPLLKGVSRPTGRHLLSTVEWERCDFEIGHKRNYSHLESWSSPAEAYAWVALYVVLILIVFVALAIICDDFFVPSLEAISEKLDLSEDVAGATFMAAGSSAPELFTSIAGVAVESDVGVGTIVGSAVFNLLGICALSAAFAGQTLKLDWRPLFRDATFYAMSIVFFIVFAWDGKFELYESVIMLINYIVYIIIMKFNPKLMDFLASCASKKKIAPVESNKSCEPENTDTASPTNNATEDGENDGADKPRRFSRVHKGYLSHEDVVTRSQVNLPAAFSHMPHVTDTQESCRSNAESEYDEVNEVVVCPCLPPVQADIPSKHGSGCFSIFRLILSWILFVVSFPFVILFTWTIPNCSTPETKKYYLFSFLMSISWIATLSFAMVTLVGRAGCILGIDKFTMGLVVVAIGTSIPDALSSILVARDGYGDMAVSNAIGSNVFDIDLGLGFPFVINSLIRDFKPVVLTSPEEQEKFDKGEILIIPHVKFGFILLIILSLSLIVFVVNRFRLTKPLGISFVFLYFAFVGYAYVQDVACDNDC